MSELYTREFRQQVLKLLIQDDLFAKKFLPVLQTSHFKEYSFKIIFDIIYDIRHKNIELEVLTKADIKTELISRVDRDIYNEVVKDLEEIFAITHINRELVEKKLIEYIRRENIKKALKQAQQKLEQGDVEGIKYIVESAFDLNIGDTDDFDLHRDYEKLHEDLKEMYNPKNTIKTGFAPIDEALYGGMLGGELYSVMAAPKTGKSTFACNIGYNVLKQGFAVIHITLELSKLEVAHKYACLLTGKTYKQVLEEYDKEEIEEFLYNEGLGQLFIKYYTPQSITVENIDGYITSLKADKRLNKRIGLIIIDYDDLLLPIKKSERDYMDSGTTYFDMIKLGKKYNAPVLTLSQPRREAWAKRDGADELAPEDIARSQQKIMNASGIFGLAKVRDSYTLSNVVCRRGEFKSFRLKTDLSKAYFGYGGDL